MITPLVQDQLLDSLARTEAILFSAQTALKMDQMTLRKFFEQNVEVEQLLGSIQETQRLLNISKKRLTKATKILLKQQSP